MDKSNKRRRMEEAKLLCPGIGKSEQYSDVLKELDGRLAETKPKPPLKKTSGRLSTTSKGSKKTWLRRIRGGTKKKTALKEKRLVKRKLHLPSSSELEQTLKDLGLKYEKLGRGHRERIRLTEKSWNEIPSEEIAKLPLDQQLGLYACSVANFMQLKLGKRIGIYNPGRKGLFGRGRVYSRVNVPFRVELVETTEDLAFRTDTHIKFDQNLNPKEVVAQLTYNPGGINEVVPDTLLPYFIKNSRDLSKFDESLHVLGVIELYERYLDVEDSVFGKGHLKEFIRENKEFSRPGFSRFLEQKGDDYSRHSPHSNDFSAVASRSLMFSLIKESLADTKLQLDDQYRQLITDIIDEGTKTRRERLFNYFSAHLSKEKAAEVADSINHLLFTKWVNPEYKGRVLENISRRYNVSLETLKEIAQVPPGLRGDLLKRYGIPEEYSELIYPEAVPFLGAGWQEHKTLSDFATERAGFSIPKEIREELLKPRWDLRGLLKAQGRLYEELATGEFAKEARGKARASGDRYAELAVKEGRVEDALRANNIKEAKSLYRGLFDGELTGEEIDRITGEWAIDDAINGEDYEKAKELAEGLGYKLTQEAMEKAMGDLLYGVSLFGFEVSRVCAEEWYRLAGVENPGKEFRGKVSEVEERLNKPDTLSHEGGKKPVDSGIGGRLKGWFRNKINRINKPAVRRVEKEESHVSLKDTEKAGSDQASEDTGVSAVGSTAPYLSKFLNREAWKIKVQGIGVNLLDILYDAVKETNKEGYNVVVVVEGSPNYFQDHSGNIMWAPKYVADLDIKILSLEGADDVKLKTTFIGKLSESFEDVGLNSRYSEVDLTVTDFPTGKSRGTRALSTEIDVLAIDGYFKPTKLWERYPYGGAYVGSQEGIEAVKQKFLDFPETWEVKIKTCGYMMGVAKWVVEGGRYRQGKYQKAAKRLAEAAQVIGAEEIRDKIKGKFKRGKITEKFYNEMVAEIEKEIQEIKLGTTSTEQETSLGVEETKVKLAKFVAEYKSKAEYEEEKKGVMIRSRDAYKSKKVDVDIGGEKYTLIREKLWNGFLSVTLVDRNTQEKYEFLVEVPIGGNISGIEKKFEIQRIAHEGGRALKPYCFSSSTG
ncbi:MAG: hypothetical protein KAU03_03150, partial [Candidatus Altiarchaeales archaeon]|nr:hypothetical protein [Candidatus Altiarchaeales archaeon]